MSIQRNWYNPFGHLTEKGARRFAKFWRSSFWQRLKDTFIILFGKADLRRHWYWSDTFEYFAPRLLNVGLIDYLSLFLLFAFRKAFKWTYENYQDSHLAAILLIPTAILNIASHILRLTLSFALTLALSPIIYIVHQLFNFFGGHKTKEDVLNIQGEDPASTKISKQMSLKKFLREYHISLEDLDAKIETRYSVKKTVNTLWDYSIGLFSKDTNQKSKGVQQTYLRLSYTHPDKEDCCINPRCIYGLTFLAYIIPCFGMWVAYNKASDITQVASDKLRGPHQDVFNIPLTGKPDSPQFKYLKALFELNVGHILEELAENEQGEELIEHILNDAYTASVALL